MTALAGVLVVLLTAFSSLAGRAAGEEPATVTADLFPSSYDQSRSRFRQLCAQAVQRHAGTCRSYRIDGRIDADLTIDYAYVSRGGSRLLIVESGAHGPEAYAGAAVQALLLRNYADRLLDRGVDLLLIHALNPYGFKYGRRVDEANVNLNRNFSRDESIYGLRAEGYSRLRWVFEPAGPVGSIWWDSLISNLRFAWALLSSGFDYRYINSSMNQGQYEFERGLNYGGSAPRQQTKFLVEEIGPLLKAYSGNVLFLDVHTGLGETGTLHVMTGLKPASAMLASARSMLGSLESERIKFTSSSDPGFYADTGDVIDFVTTLAANPDKALALTMEFGTLGTGTLQQLEAASRMVLENQAHFYGCSEPAVCRQAQTDFLELFNPSDPQWRTAVARQADRLLSVVAARF